MHWPKRQVVKNQGHTVTKTVTVARLLVTRAATAVCCCCRCGSACRYDYLCFLVGPFIRYFLPENIVNGKVELTLNGFKTSKRFVIDLQWSAPKNRLNIRTLECSLFLHFWLTSIPERHSGPHSFGPSKNLSRRFPRLHCRLESAVDSQTSTSVDHYVESFENYYVDSCLADVPRSTQPYSRPLHPSWDIRYDTVH